MLSCKHCRSAPVSDAEHSTETSSALGLGPLFGLAAGLDTAKHIPSWKEGTFGPKDEQLTRAAALQLFVEGIGSSYTQCIRLDLKLQMVSHRE